VVAGIRTPQPIALEMEAAPRGLQGARRGKASLEKHYRDMQDIEFTVEEASSTCSRRARQAHGRGGGEDRLDMVEGG
jgi:pyruvate,orthophosphate dikinase